MFSTETYKFANASVYPKNSQATSSVTQLPNEFSKKHDLVILTYLQGCHAEGSRKPFPKVKVNFANPFLSSGEPFSHPLQSPDLLKSFMFLSTFVSFFF